MNTLKIVDSQKEHTIPFVSLRVTAGIVEHFADEVDLLEQTIALPNGHHADIAFEVEGDSMEPTVSPQDIVYCSRLKEWRSLPSNYQTMYVILFNDSLTLKYVVNRQKDNGTIELWSENRDLYPNPEIIFASDIRAMWKVVGLYRILRR